MPARDTPCAKRKRGGFSGRPGWFYQEAYDRLTLLNAKYAGVASYQNDLALACADLADMLRVRKEPERAWTMLQESLTLRQKLVADNPFNFDYRPDLSVALGKASAMLAAKDDLPWVC